MTVVTGSWLRRFAAAAVAVALLWPVVAPRAQDLVAVPPLRSPVTDLTGTLTPEQSAELEAKLRAFALGVWDTDANNGVLICVLLADHDVEIVADRGFNAKVDASEWSAIYDAMERHFRAGEFEAGAVAGVRLVGEVVARHFPLRPGERSPNELPNRPALL